MREIIDKALAGVASKKIKLDAKLIEKIYFQLDSLLCVVKTDADVDFVTNSMRKLRELELVENDALFVIYTVITLE